MSKFKVGDKVVRTDKGFEGMKIGETYVVTGVSAYGGWIDINGSSGEQYNCAYFELVEDNQECGQEDDTTFLTPLQAAEAIFNGEALQVYDTECEKWYTFSCGLRSITLEDLKSIKLRHKPKTIVVNGVDVPAPLSSLPSEGVVWSIAGFERVFGVGVKYRLIPKIYWSTEEDAEEVLDAMLIPFK